MPRAKNATDERGTVRIVVLLENDGKPVKGNRVATKRIKDSTVSEIENDIRGTFKFADVGERKIVKPREKGGSKTKRIEKAPQA